MARELNTSDLLNVWQQGLNQPPLQRALILLVAACPQVAPDELTELSIGQRDTHLFHLHTQLFGSELLNTAVCPDCSERVEWKNSISDILAPSPDDQASAISSSEIGDPMPTDFELKVDDYRLEFRLPNSLDISAVLNFDSNDDAQIQLLSRCIAKAESAGKEVAANKLPDEVFDVLANRIEELDPHADIRINLQCPECSRQWDALFDISSFLWAELSDWAERTLHSIHQLARSYGWTEQEILNLNPLRRQLYLGMLSQ